MFLWTRFPSKGSDMCTTSERQRWRRIYQFRFYLEYKRKKMYETKE
jgi:hypothetical protein